MPLYDVDGCTATYVVVQPQCGVQLDRLCELLVAGQAVLLKTMCTVVLFR
jgi:hypothetical protein